MSDYGYQEALTTVAELLRKDDPVYAIAKYIHANTDDPGTRQLVRYQAIYGDD